MAAYACNWSTGSGQADGRNFLASQLASPKASLVPSLASAYMKSCMYTNTCLSTTHRHMTHQKNKDKTPNHKRTQQIKNAYNYI